MAEEQGKQDDKDDILKDVEVVIEGDPGDDDAPAQKKADDKPKKEDEGKERSAKDVGKDDDEDERKELEGKDDEEREAIRERRRQERKLRKERADAEAAELRLLRQKVSELESRTLEHDRRVKTGEFERIENGISEAVQKMELAKAAMQKAATDGNWADHTQALEAYNSWRQRGEYLVNVKQNIVHTARRQQEQPKPDPEVMRHAREWMTRNPWYDPSAGDEDSKIAFAIDEALAGAGFDPKTKEYWQEFDKRLAKRLPHRVKGKQDADEADEGRDDSPSRTSGSGRERASSNGKETFRLSAERVKAMREAGVWDDEVARKKHIAAYIEYDKKAKAQEKR